MELFLGFLDVVTHEIYSRWEYPNGSRFHDVKREEVPGSPVKVSSGDSSVNLPITKRIAELEAEGTSSNRKRVSFSIFFLEKSSLKCQNVDNNSASH